MDKRRAKRNNGDDEDDELMSIDWTNFFELAVLCPVPVNSADDRELDRVLSGDEPVPCLQGTVLM